MKMGVIHQAMYLVGIIIGAKYGWLLGHDHGGVFLGVVLAIVGAVVCSTLVGIIAILLGFKPGSPKGR